MDLYPVKINRDGGLGKVDMALRNDGPGDYLENRVMYQIVIVDGIAKVFTCDNFARQFVYEDWEYVEDLGPASAVAVEFNGRWERIPNGRYRFYSEGEPFYFLVQDGNLNVMRRESAGGALATTPLATGVSLIDTVRGWKNVGSPEVDQGLIVAYITAGAVYYRNFAEQANGTWTWESEKEVEFDAGVLDPPESISAFRAIDYRTGFLAQFGSTTRMVLTRRDWAQMGTPDELISVNITDYNLDVYRIFHTTVGPGPFPTDDYRSRKDQWRWGEYDNEKIAASIVDYGLLALWAGTTEPITAENVESERVQSEAPIATGDGTTTEFLTGWYPVKPDTEVIKLNGVTQTKDVDYTIDYPTGTITFLTAPGDGVEITAAYTWFSWGHKIKITFGRGIQNEVGHHAQVVVQDSLSNNYNCNATLGGGEPWADPIPLGRFDGTREWFLETSNFNECEGDLTAGYTQNGLQGEADQQVGSFNTTFTPINLIAQRISIDPPEVEAIWNE